MMTRMLLWAVILGYISLAPVVWAEFNISIDFSKARAPANLSGFLLDIDPDNAFTEVRPALVRTNAVSPWFSTDQYTRTQDVGAKFMYVLSDGYMNAGYGSTPFADSASWANWELYLRSVLREHKLKTDIIWDIWNEPNGDQYWGGSEEQYFEHYKKSYRILREELGPDALVTGPSTDGWDSTFIYNFMNYCVTNQLEVNVFNYHEFTGEWEFEKIEARLLEFKTRIIQNHSYSTLKMSAIMAPEIGHMAIRYDPSKYLAIFYYLERGGVTRGAKSCWNDCTNNSLDGSVDPDNASRRKPVWWAYKVYADGTAARVASESDNTGIVALASSATYSDANQAQIIITQSGNMGSALWTNQVNVLLQNLKSIPAFANATSVRISTKQLPFLDDYDAYLDSLESIGEMSYTFDSNGDISFVVQSSTYNSLVLTLTPQGSPTSVVKKAVVLTRPSKQPFLIFDVRSSVIQVVKIKDGIEYRSSLNNRLH